MIIIQRKNTYNIGTQSTSISHFVVTRKMMKTITNAKLISSILAYSQRASAVCEIPKTASQNNSSNCLTFLNKDLLFYEEMSFSVKLQ